MHGRRRWRRARIRRVAWPRWQRRRWRLLWARWCRRWVGRAGRHAQLGPAQAGGDRLSVRSVLRNVMAKAALLVAAVATGAGVLRRAVHDDLVESVAVEVGARNRNRIWLWVDGVGGAVRQHSLVLLVRVSGRLAVLRGGIAVDRRQRVVSHGHDVYTKRAPIIEVSVAMDPTQRHRRRLRIEQYLRLLAIVDPMKLLIRPWRGHVPCQLAVRVEETDVAHKSKLTSRVFAVLRVHDRVAHSRAFRFASVLARIQRRVETIRHAAVDVVHADDGNAPHRQQRRCGGQWWRGRKRWR